MDPVPSTRKLVIPSEPGAACHVVEAVMTAVEAHGYHENARFAIRLALDEALSNAIRHGNRNDPHKRIEVEFSVTDEQVRLSIRDEGSGFRPERVPDPTLDENLERPNGRGVLLMRAYMTQVHFNRAGNCVTLVKDRNCPLPLPPQPR